MIKLHFRNLDYVRPPGTLIELLNHPDEAQNETVELALFNEHRYAFFFWNKWRNELLEDSIAEPPCLVTLDWHQDLMWPDETEKKWLDELDLSNNRDVSLYSWANLTPINDGQIMAAAYLNLVGNIYVHCRQGKNESKWKEVEFTDKFGNIHTVRKFKTYDGLENHMLQSDEKKVFFDIDLDFFTLNNPYNGVGNSYSYLKDPEIKAMLAVKRPLIEWIFKRMCGFTIAIEPEHCGGLLKAHKLLNVIDQLYFTPSLFANYGSNWSKSTEWKHRKRID